MRKIIDYKGKTIKFIVFLGILVSVIVILFRMYGKGEHEAEVVRLPQKEKINLEIEFWQGEGFVGTLLENDSILEGRKGEKIIVIFEEDVEIVQTDGSFFEFNFEEPNAEMCNLPEGTEVDVLYESYMYITGNEIHIRIFGCKVVPCHI